MIDASSAPKGYRPQLDGLRTLAVAVVLLYHFTPQAWHAVLLDGSRGVELFFVLSGFLISSILWRGRLAVAQGSVTRKGTIARFFLRRTLRIFPIYYLTIGFAVVAGLGITTHELKWYVFYVPNYLFVFRGHLGGPTSHLWSLAVEEQFYILWPTLMLLLPRKVLLGLMGLAVAIGPAYRFWAVRQGLPLRELLLPGCIDLFALGALLAISSVEKRRWAGGFARACLASSAVLWGILALLPGAVLPAGFGAAFARSAMGLFSLWLIAGANRGFAAVGGRVLSARPIVYLGRISYGIYLYHNFVAEGVEKLRELYGLPRFSAVVDLVVLSLATVGMAAASWHFLEEPISRLKDRWTKPGAASSIAPAAGQRLADGTDANA